MWSKEKKNALYNEQPYNMTSNHNELTDNYCF